jgi:predicted SAM-dependent methyltransferase
MRKINLGCGANRLEGWQNFDREIDIAKPPLPFGDRSVDYILCEHCLEHIGYYKAIEFLKECKRVLKPGGVARIIVPSLERIANCNDEEYFKFTTKWQQNGPTVRGALAAILFAHGHESAWTSSLLRATMVYCGFNPIDECQPERSKHEVLRDVDGHHHIIGRRFNDVESTVIEGMA